MQSNIVPRVAAMHDIVGVGRCSLTVIIPVLSSMGIQVCPVPTAVLSSHTGGFAEPTFEDLTTNMTKYLNHWECENLKFDALYSGYVGSNLQFPIMEKFIKDFKMREKLIVIDPVFADNGKMYKGFDHTIVHHMQDFIKNAHVITPNITEAAYLLGEDPQITDLSIGESKKWLKALCAKGASMSVITGIIKTNYEGEKTQINTIAYNSTDDKFWQICVPYINASYHGTGDIFASVLTGALINGENLPNAINRGAKFVHDAILITYASGTPRREGVMLEKILNTLQEPLDTIFYKEI